MTVPDDFEEQLRERLARTAAPVGGDEVSLAGVAARHGQRAARRRRVRATAVSTFAALALAGGALALDRDEPVSVDAADDSGTSSTIATTTSSTITSTTTSSTTTTTPLPPEWPAALTELEHGGTSWGVYVAVATAFEDPELQDAVDRVEGLGQGYRAAAGDVGCDQGAREALGLDPDTTYYAVAVYFAELGSAQRFVDLFPTPVVGVAEVQTYCLD